MSSSNESRISRRTPAKTQNEIQRDIDKKKSRKILTIVIMVCVVILALALIYINTGLFYRTTPAVTVGDRNFSIADFNYYYKTAYNNTYNNIYSTYGSYASYILDPSKPLDQQSYSTDMTWEEYFSQVAVSKMRTVVLLCDMADADENFSLTEAQQKELDSIEDIPATYAKIYKLSVGKYLRNIYGMGVSKSVYVRNTKDVYIADAYTQYIKDNYDYSDSDLESYYNANITDFNVVNYKAYLVTAESGDGVDSEKALADAKSAAEKLIEGADSMQAFADNVAEYESANELSTGETTGSYAKYAGVNSAIADWLFDTARVSGDTAVIENSDKTGYYAVYFDSVDDRNYPTGAIRQILVGAELDENGSYSEATLKDAHDKADQLLAEWKSGDMSEDSFTKLYSESDSEYISGSFIDMIYHGATGVDPVEEWALDAARQPGDTTLIDTEYGTHILYYSAAVENAQKALVRNAKSDADYTSWMESAIEDYTAVIRGFGYYFTRNV